MATDQLRRVIHSLRRATVAHDGAGPSDGQLLESYVAGREEAAFAALVHRHGPMVWGVCRRVLDSHQDAEDAFQATFLVLVRKAASVLPRDLVANWLYGVARQVSMKARMTAARRRGREKQVTIMPEPAVEPQLWDDLQPLLDQELSRLPEKYRAVIVLCDLHGKTRKEAARQFKLPEGTVATRLATARAMLAKRLKRRGLPLSAAMLAAALGENVVRAQVPASVAHYTIKAATAFAAGQATAAGSVSVKAVALAEGALKTMLLTKLKIALAVMVSMAVLGTGAVSLTHVVAEKPGDTPKQACAEKREPKKQKQALATQPAKQKSAEALPAVVTGVAKSVDDAYNKLTITHNRGETTFNVTKDATINMDGKPGDLGAVPAGASVALRDFTDQTTTRSVLAEGRWLWGTVKTVDAANSSITLGDEAQDWAAGKTFSVPADLPLSIDGKQGKLAGIPQGAIVNLQLLADQQTVRSMSAEGAQISGLAKAVDAARNTITVNDMTYSVGPDAQIGIDFKQGALAGLPAGANVTLNLQTDQKTVLRISASGSSVFGTVKSVDAANNTITVKGNPDDKTCNIAADTAITIDGQPGKLADIPPGSGLHALNLRVDQRTAHGINVVGPGFHHVPVKAVDADKNTITIDDKAPTEVAGKTLSVAADANIEIDGKSGTLAAIPVGAFVNLGLSVNLQTARNLQAEGPNLGGCGGSMVKAVDAANSTITFDDNAIAEAAGKTFTVAKDVWIQIDGKPGKLAEVPPGSYLNITLTVDQQLARLIPANGPRVSGVLKAADIANSTITVDDQSYTVARDALILIDGTPGQLGALVIGTNVSVNLRVDQKTAGMIQTQAAK